jgi:7,8-dihydropterin-6-yl-methyl-4-(beta-D-ribofuranosyl)aminobenzene 5'-phosphate synthase
MPSLIEINSLEVQVIVDNEVDPISTYTHPDLKVGGQMPDVAMKAPLSPDSRGGARAELRMDNLCCGAHGLSLLVVCAHPLLVYY